MAFKIRPEDFEKGAKFIEVISCDYGKSICLRVNEDNSYELIKYEAVPISIVSKGLADHLANENVAISSVRIKNKVYDVPTERGYSQMQKELKVFLQNIDSQGENI